MTFAKAWPALLTLALATGSVHAQNWSTNFDTPGDRDGSFTGLSTTGGVLTGFYTLPPGVPAGTDAYLALFDPLLSGQATARLTFTAVATAELYQIAFAALDIGDSPLTVSLKHVGSGREATQQFDPNTTTVNFKSGQFLEQPNIGTAAHAFSHEFGNALTPWEAGDYTLTFSNGRNLLRPYALDDVSVTAVPEPGAYALMLAGLGVLGLVARRKNRAAAA